METDQILREISKRSAVGEAYQYLTVSADEVVVSAAAGVSGRAKSVGIYAIARAVNDVAAGGARPEQIALQVYLSSPEQKKRVKPMIRFMEEYACQLPVEITGVQIETVPYLEQPLVYVSVMGKAEKAKLLSTTRVRPGQSIVLCGYVGLEGMLRILDERRQELSKRFTPAFINQMTELKSILTPLPAIQAAIMADVCAVYQIKSGGILAALWELGESAGVGMELQLSNMSIRQETIEVCEFYHLNPYQMTSAGSFLMVTDDADRLTAAITAGGSRASKLGITTGGKAKVITSGTEKRFLDRPVPDELMRWAQEAK